MRHCDIIWIYKRIYVGRIIFKIYEFYTAKNSIDLTHHMPIAVIFSILFNQDKGFD